MSKIDTENGVINFDLNRFNDKLKLLCEYNEINYSNFLKDLNEVAPTHLEECLAGMIFSDYNGWKPILFL